MHSASTFVKIKTQPAIIALLPPLEWYKFLFAAH